LVSGAPPRIPLGSLPRSPDPLAEISNSLFEIITEMLGKSNSELKIQNGFKTVKT